MTDRVGQQFNNYYLERLLGRDNLAETYLARNLQRDRQVAVKIFHLRLDPPEHEPFRKEAQSIAELSQINIIHTLDYGINTNDSLPYIVQEFIPNGTLRQRYPLGARLPLNEVVAYAKQVATALHFAHERKIIHRAVRPESMYLGQQNEIRLGDFAVPVIWQKSWRGSSRDAAVAPYLAPEVLQGTALPASDQYALAVVIYELLSGERPLGWANQGSAFKPLNGRVPGVPADVDRVLMTALSPDPQRRFAMIQAFANALEQSSISFERATEMASSNPMVPTSLQSSDSPPLAGPPSNPQNRMAPPVPQAGSNIYNPAVGPGVPPPPPGAPLPPPQNIMQAPPPPPQVSGAMPPVGNQWSGAIPRSNGGPNRGQANNPNFYAAPNTPSSLSGAYRPVPQNPPTGPQGPAPATVPSSSSPDQQALHLGAPVGETQSSGDSTTASFPVGTPGTPLPGQMTGNAATSTTNASQTKKKRSAIPALILLIVLLLGISAASIVYGAVWHGVLPWAASSPTTTTQTTTKSTTPTPDFTATAQVYATATATANATTTVTATTTATATASATAAASPTATATSSANGNQVYSADTKNLKLVCISDCEPGLQVTVKDIQVDTTKDTMVWNMSVAFNGSGNCQLTASLSLASTTSGDELKADSGAYLSGNNTLTSGQTFSLSASFPHAPQTGTTYLLHSSQRCSYAHYSAANRQEQFKF